MTLPGPGEVNEVPDAVIGRAVRDPGFRTRVLAAANEEAIKAIVEETLGIELEDAAARQLSALNKARVEAALQELQTQVGSRVGGPVEPSWRGRGRLDVGGRPDAGCRMARVRR